MNRFFLAAIFALLALPVWGQTSLTLDIRDGRVNLDATAVPARQILAEWARIGGTKVVGAEKISGAPLTLKLEDMPEQQALDIILRSVAGYMAAPRRATAEAGASAYDRIVILPTTSAPAAATANTNARTPNPGLLAGTERRVPPRPPGMPEPDGDEAMQTEPPSDTGDGFQMQQPPVFTFPQPQVPGNANQLFQPVPQQGFGVPMQPGAQPQLTLQPGANGQPQIYNFMPGGAAPASGGFGVIGSPTPGMVQQPTPAPGQPVAVPPRPPGGN